MRSTSCCRSPPLTGRCSSATQPARPFSTVGVDRWEACPGIRCRARSRCSPAQPRPAGAPAASLLAAAPRTPRHSSRRRSTRTPVPLRHARGPPRGCRGDAGSVDRTLDVAAVTAGHTSCRPAPCARRRGGPAPSRRPAARPPPVAYDEHSHEIGPSGSRSGAHKDQWRRSAARGERRVRRRHRGHRQPAGGGSTTSIVLPRSGRRDATAFTEAALCVLTCGTARLRRGGPRGHPQLLDAHPSTGGCTGVPVKFRRLRRTRGADHLPGTVPAVQMGRPLTGRRLRAAAVRHGEISGSAVGSPIHRGRRRAC